MNRQNINNQSVENSLESNSENFLIEPYYLPYEKRQMLPLCFTYWSVYLNKNKSLTQLPELRIDINNLIQMTVASLLKSTKGNKIKPSEMLYYFKGQSILVLMELRGGVSKSFFANYINQPSEREMHRMLELQHVLGEAIEEGLTKHLLIEAQREQLICSTEFERIGESKKVSKI